MIAKDFHYYKPEKVEEAVRLHKQYQLSGYNAYYYAGGTEIISFSRKGFLNVDTVIDIKGIPGINSVGMHENKVLIGAAATLTDTANAHVYPLLSDSVRHIADHTNQNKITVGGNLCGQIIYREAVLPFLLADSEVSFMTSKGLRRDSVHTHFNGKLSIPDDGLLLWIETKQQFTVSPYYYEKVTKMEKVDYPIVTIAAMRIDENIRVALSGVCLHPFRSEKMESILSVKNKAIGEKINEAIKHIPDAIIDDTLASAEFRKYVLKNVLRKALLHLKGDE